MVHKCPVTQGKEEAEAVARLLARDGERVVGLLYLWNTSELSILWIGEYGEASTIDPPLSTDVLAKAKSICADEVIELIEALSVDGTSGEE